MRHLRLPILACTALLAAVAVRTPAVAGESIGGKRADPAPADERSEVYLVQIVGLADRVCRSNGPVARVDAAETALKVNARVAANAMRKLPQVSDIKPCPGREDAVLVLVKGGTRFDVSRCTAHLKQEGLGRKASVREVKRYDPNGGR